MENGFVRRSRGKLGGRQQVVTLLAEKPKGRAGICALSGGAIHRGAFSVQAEDGIRDWSVTGVQTCALPISIGRVDNSTTDGLKSGLDAYVASCSAGGDRLVLDFSKVDYISSVGLRVLMLAAKQIREQGGSVVVAALQPVVREIFEISRFNLVFQCFGSVREALAKVS